MESQGIQKGLKRKILNQWYLCPHMAVKHLPNIGAEEYEIDRNRYMCMQTRLGLVLFGVLGAKKLETFGYPDKTVTEILEMVLFKTKTPVIYYYSNSLEILYSRKYIYIIIIFACYRCNLPIIFIFII